MIILGVDTTAVIGSVAVCEIENKELKSHVVFTVKNKLTHSETLLPMIDGALKTYGIDIDKVDKFAVSVGPGSFTGVRIGVSTVKGLATKDNKPCAAVSTLEALCNSHKDFDGVICAVMDARRGQFYTALFKRFKNNLFSDEGYLTVDHEGNLTACPIENYNDNNRVVVITCDAETESGRIAGVQFQYIDTAALHSHSFPVKFTTDVGMDQLHPAC